VIRNCLTAVRSRKSPLFAPSMVLFRPYCILASTMSPSCGSRARCQTTSPLRRNGARQSPSIASGSVSWPLSVSSLPCRNARKARLYLNRMARP
jgi:hypothetical protein